MNIIKFIVGIAFTVIFVNAIFGLSLVLVNEKYGIFGTNWLKFRRILRVLLLPMALLYQACHFLSEKMK